VRRDSEPLQSDPGIFGAGVSEFIERGERGLPRGAGGRMKRLTLVTFRQGWGALSGKVVGNLDAVAATGAAVTASSAILEDSVRDMVRSLPRSPTSIPDSQHVLHGCYASKSGTLRIIDTGAGATCIKDE
jgi:hypothetical protein